MKNKKLVHYGLVQMMEDIGKLEKELKFLNFNFKNIYGVPRGGLIIAVVLSHRLKLPLILSANKISDETLIVDDISDTGKTLKKIAKKNSIVATLWTTPHTKFKPNYYVNVLKKDEWVVFPFETIKSSKRDGTI
jgi:hypoxanthine phosphoribosyltransferase